MITAFKYLHPKNWSRLGKQYDKKDINFVLLKPKILLSQLAVIGFLASLIHIVIDLYESSGMTAITLDIISGIVMLIIYLLNEMKRYTFARYLFFIFLNAVLFIFANLLPKERGVYLIFFPVIVLTFPMFSPERKNILFFSGLSICLIIICEIFDYQLFGHVVSDSSQYGSFIANLLLAIGVSVMAINFLVNINEEAKTFLNELILKWNQKNKDLEKANAELDRFVYSTSHELRSPLLSILGLVNLLEKESEKETGKDYLRMIKKSITKQDEFITEILQYSRNARLKVTVEAFNLKDFVKDVVNDCRLLEGADSVKFIFDIQVDQYIKTDKSRLSIILNNLITNSVKYRNRHNDSFVKIKASIKDNVLYMELSDNGIGIAKSQHDLVFNMFHRATEESNGSGLGLYIVSEMVNKLEGKIEMESEDGAGTRFSLFIPIKQSDAVSG